jgi:hypothetical protein
VGSIRPVADDALSCLADFPVLAPLREEEEEASGGVGIVYVSRELLDREKRIYHSAAGQHIPPLY